MENEISKDGTFILIEILYFEYNLSGSEFPNFKFKLSTDKVIAKSFLSDKDVEVVIGELYCDSLQNNNCLYFNDYDYTEHINTQILWENINSQLQHWLFSLWLIRDHSVNYPNTFIQQFPPNEKYLLIEHQSLVFTNCKGIFETVSYNKDEISESIKLFEIILANNNIAGAVSTIQAYETGKSHYNRSSFADISYNLLNRVNRAYFFINLARSNDLLPYKVCFFEAALESLFTTDENNIGNKLCEGVTKYVGGTPTEMFRTYKLVKAAFKMRSNFIHGGEINSDKAYLLKITADLDGLLRKVLLKVLNIDLANFTLPQADFITYLQTQIKDPISVDFPTWYKNHLDANSMWDYDL